MDLGRASNPHRRNLSAKERIAEALVTPAKVLTGRKHAGMDWPGAAPYAFWVSEVSLRLPGVF